MQLPLNEKEIKATIFTEGLHRPISFWSDMTAEVSEGKDLSGGLGSFMRTLLSLRFLSVLGKQDKMLKVRMIVEFLGVYYCWQYLNFSYKFYSAVGLSTVSLKDKENLISGKKNCHI